MENNYDEALRRAFLYKDIFGENNFFLSSRTMAWKSKTVNESLFKISRETGLRLVATNDVHYINKEDAYFHDVLLCIKPRKP